MVATFVATAARRFTVPCLEPMVVGQYADRRIEQEWTSAGAAMR